MSNALDGAFDYDPSQEEIKPTTVADDRFRLISTLISTPDALSAGAKEFKALETLIRSDFLKLAAGVGIPGESALYNELLVLLSDLRDLIEFPHLANKNVLAIGGGFSSGKSGFLNAILGETDLLPEGIRETTAIPTYLTHADEESILALNTFDRTQRLTRAELTAISHAFNAGQSEESKIQFYHILKLIQIQSPCMKWRNVALLDTPGYSKPNIGDAAAEGTNAGNTDEEKAREHLSLADHLIWSIAGKDGVLQGPDIAFLRDKVQWPRPFYLLINKCDELAKSDVKGIFDGSLAAAKAAGFEIAGASAFSARTVQGRGREGNPLQRRRGEALLGPGEKPEARLSQGRRCIDARSDRRRQVRDVGRGERAQGPCGRRAAVHLVRAEGGKPADVDPQEPWRVRRDGCGGGA